MTDSVPKSALDIDGWMFLEELEWLSDQAAKSSSVAEIGCWKGRSTFALLSACPGLVYAVDHFRGSPDEPGHAEARQNAGAIRAQFIANCGHFPNLKLIERDSITAAAIFEPGELDMVFIDASHGYQDVVNDICAWSSKVRRGGIFAGHDYAPREWPGVVQAVRSCLGVPKRAAQSIWYVEVGA